MKPIVFLGPTFAPERARDILDAEYRPPIRRGDLAQLGDGAVVGIIDGVFDQTLAVSPREIHQALQRGVRLFGSSSMGALRAVEVPGVIGIGRVFEMYRDAEIEDDDEVAVAFDAESNTSLSVPLVNVRYAVDRLVRPGTIRRAMGQQILRAAQRLPYPERTYSRILREAKLDTRPDAKQLKTFLESYDLKRDDAITLLERLRNERPGTRSRRSKRARSDEAKATAEAMKASEGATANAPILFWEYGDRVDFKHLLTFLKCTGRFKSYARNAVSRFVLQGNPLKVGMRGVPSRATLRDRVVVRLIDAWQLAMEEEVLVTLRDVGLSASALEERVREEADAERRVMALARASSDEFLLALRAELFMNELALKREAIRCGSLALFARRGRESGPASKDELRAATWKLCELVDEADARAAFASLAEWGVAQKEAEAFIETLALARRGSADIVALMEARASALGRLPALRIERSPKNPGDPRFCVPLRDAFAATKHLRSAVGITRVAMITGLGDIGIPNAQAFRPDGTWSSTVGSGKSASVLGAKVGAVMEEVEKWAQEQFPREGVSVVELSASYEELRARNQRALDPGLLDLPYDTRYRPDMAIGWRACPDLIGGGKVLVPSAALDRHRVRDDVYYSVRAGRKLVTSNGLASGFTLAEALTHALCEYIERHAKILHEIKIDNPGMHPNVRHTRIDLATLPPSTRQLLDRIERTGRRLHVSDITSEVRVPTFCASIFVEEGPATVGFARNLGGPWASAAHPDPSVAVHMAVLEAAQNIMTFTAGAREDLTFEARSLGRLERTRATTSAAYISFRSYDRGTVPFPASAGYVSRDARKDVIWVLERLRDAGCTSAPMLDLSLPEIRPARVVRVLLPGLESPNPFRTGLRARVQLLRDLVD